MGYIDVTKPIFTGMKKYLSDPAIQIQQFKSLKKGNSCNLNKLVIGSHAGTHIDAPYHIFGNADTIDKIAIKNFICNVLVIDILECLNPTFLKKISKGDIKGILFKDGKSKAYLTVEKAEMLIKNKMKVIGTEQMSIESSSDKTHPVHKLLLSKRITIIENLDLKKVRQGCYKLICLPLKIIGGDGAPARAILEYD